MRRSENRPKCSRRLLSPDISPRTLTRLQHRRQFSSPVPRCRRIGPSLVWLERVASICSDSHLYNMKTYSQDLRERVVRACAEGRGTRQQIADLFGVSTAWIRRLLQRHRTTPSMRRACRTTTRPGDRPYLKLVRYSAKARRSLS